MISLEYDTAPLIISARIQNAGRKIRHRSQKLCRRTLFIIRHLSRKLPSPVLRFFHMMQSLNFWNIWQIHFLQNSFNLSSISAAKIIFIISPITNSHRCVGNGSVYGSGFLFINGCFLFSRLFNLRFYFNGISTICFFLIQSFVCSDLEIICLSFFQALLCQIQLLCIADLLILAFL